MPTKPFLLILFFFCTCLLAAQEEMRRELSFSQWVTEMQECDSGVYVLEHATVKFDPLSDNRFLPKDSTNLAILDTVVISCAVVLEDVILDNYHRTIDYADPVLEWNKLRFNKLLGLVNVRSTHAFTIKNCEFRDSLIIKDCELNQIHVENSIFKFGHGLHFWNSRASQLSIHECTFQGIVVFEGLEAQNVFVEKSLFESCEIHWCDIGRVIWIKNGHSVKLDFVSCEVNSLEVVDNSFHFTKNDSLTAKAWTIRINFQSVNSENFYFYGNSISGGLRDIFIIQNFNSGQFLLSNNRINAPVTLRRIEIEGLFEFQNNQGLNKGLYLHDIDFGTRSAIDWQNFKGKIIQSDFKGVRSQSKPVELGLFELGLLEEELDNTEYTESLIKTKRKFYNVFQEQGLTQNANEVLVEIKSLETALKFYEYQKTKTLESYFDWRANQFLFDFSSYGTDIVKALAYAFKVMLFFALFYLFFHNDWDFGSSRIIRERLDFLMDYFRKKEGLHSLYKDRSHQNFVEIQSFKSKVKSSKREVPQFLFLLSSLYYKPIIFGRYFKLKLLRKMDVLEGAWLSKSPQERRRSSRTVMLWMGLLAAMAVIVKFLNAITLSINALTTLGFGRIPTRGAARYIAILEGFVGWGLMTLFSATLIKQLMY